MRRHDFSLRQMSNLCAEFGEEDGVHPHRRSRPGTARTSRRGGSDGGLDRKVLQLCHQVAETLEEVLADCGDGILQALRVLDVEPAPDASRLLVTVALEAPPEEATDIGQVHVHLSRASGHLRGEVATAITRKRTPVLIYRLAAAGADDESPR
jgi:ribosome-binding factor A